MFLRITNRVFQLKFLSMQDEPWYNGGVFVLILICTEIVQTIFLHRYFHKCVRSAMHVSCVHPGLLRTHLECHDDSNY